jgi:mannose-1-phosphate guanylyltransferase/mannose-6-phosphate isomerase
MILAADTPDALMLIAPSDHVILNTTGLRDAIATAAKAAAGGALVTFGVKPTKAHTGFGYIKRGEALDCGACHRVARFVEKPDLKTAEEYLAAGDYFWNSGMFLFRAGTFLDELERLNPAMLEGCRASLAAADEDLDFLRLAAEPFEAMKGDSIDYAVMEHTEHAAVMPIDVGWSDLGAWGALWELGEKDDAGNVLVGDALVHDTRDTYIRSEAPLVTAVGVENLIIVATEDAVLVADRDKAEAVRHIVAALAEQGRSEPDAHVRVLRPWGAFEGIKQGPGYQVKVLTVNPGAGISLQYHNQRAEHWVVVSGHARVTRDDDVLDLSPNESTYIPLRAVHRLENPGSEPLQVVEVQTGDYLGEDDIVRIEDRYGRG